MSPFLRRGFLTAVLTAIPWAHAGPLDVWTPVPSGTTNTLRAVACSGGLFVAAGDSGTLLSSPDGLQWTLQPSGVTNSFRGLAYNNGLFVAVGTQGTLCTSSNGLEWTVAQSGTMRHLNAVAATHFGFAAVGDLGKVLISSNGLDWISRAISTSANLMGAGSGFGKVYVGAAANPPALFWSTDGFTWLYLTNVPAATQPQLFNGGFVEGDGVLLGLSFRGIFCRSTDGETWSNRNSPFDYCFGLSFARHVFLGVGGNYDPRGFGRRIGTSTNGVDWITRYHNASEGRLLGVAYGKHRFVATGDAGAILVSAPLLWLRDPVAGPGGLEVTLQGDPGAVYKIQSVADYDSISWSNAATVTNHSESLRLILPVAGNTPSRFYKVLAQ